MRVVLGISPGTRSTGIAVLRDGRLMQSKVLTFRGAWGQAKMRSILHYLSQCMDRNKVEVVAIKIPDELPLSQAYIRLLGALNVLCERKGMKAVYYTLSDLKKYYCPGRKINKKVLAECVARKYPDLYLELRKEQSNDNPYYHKLFEAVAAAHLLQRIRIQI
jgi:Holliday junction resolvasome RuvABC endonuclease subunit